MKDGYLVFNAENRRLGIMNDGEWINEGLHAGDYICVKINGFWKPGTVEMNAEDEWYIDGVPEAGMNAEVSLHHLPPLVSGMTGAELEAFKDWTINCCGMDFNNLTYNQLNEGASLWYDEGELE